MRVAMGLALNEIDREARAIEFYEVLSSFDFMSSTPTLFNSGTPRRNCRAATHHRTRHARRHLRIAQGKRPAVQVRRWSGQRLDAVRALGSHIQGTNGQSQGVVPSSRWSTTPPWP